MALCKHGCGTDLTWMAGTDGKSRPYGPDGQPHRCAEGLAAFKAAKAGPHLASAVVASTVLDERGGVHTQVVQEPPSRTTTGGPYSVPVERSEVQELRHAVQRLSRAVEMLTEVVQDLVTREMTRT